MPFDNIKRIKEVAVTSTGYFVDAQVWIYALQGDTLLKWWQEVYVNFFYDIIESELEPRPKIIMPTLLFSEILNTWLTKIALPEYLRNNPLEQGEKFVFKKHYRNTPHYQENFEKICDDILSLKSSLLFVSDSLIVSDHPAYINTSIDPFDFNDFVYYTLCREMQKSSPLSIVTHDGDFQVCDIPIITNHRDLLALKR